MFLVYEKWESGEALDAHLSGPHLVELAARIPELLDERGLTVNWARASRDRVGSAVRRPLSACCGSPGLAAAHGAGGITSYPHQHYPPQMRIVVRNLAGATYPGNPFGGHQAARRASQSVLATDADVLLLQEAALTLDLWQSLPGYRVTASAPDSRWGSLVAARESLAADAAWRPRSQVLDAFGDYVATALVHVSGSDVALVSVHSPTKWWDHLWNAVGGTGSCPTGMTRPWPSDLLLDALLEALDGVEAIVAGDWNEAPNYPKDGDAATREWFDRARSTGWVKVVAETFRGPVGTNFTRGTTRAYQNDHVFVTPAVAAMVDQVGVWHEFDGAASDHAGIDLVLRP